MFKVKLSEEVLAIIKPKVADADVVTEAAKQLLLSVMGILIEVDEVGKRLHDFNVGSVFQHTFTSFNRKHFDGMGYFYDNADVLTPLLNREVGSIEGLLTLVEKSDSDRGFVVYVIKHGDFYFAVLTNYAFFYKYEFVSVQLTAVVIDSTLHVESIDDI